jgi:hypothetical protein
METEKIIIKNSKIKLSEMLNNVLKTDDDYENILNELRLHFRVSKSSRWLFRA